MVDIVADGCHRFIGGHSIVASREDVLRATKSLVSLGPAVLVTLGERGAMLVNQAGRCDRWMLKVGPILGP